ASAPGSARAMVWPSSLRSVILSIDISGAAGFSLLQQDAVKEGFRSRRAPGALDAHGHDAIAAANHGVGIVIVAAAIGAGAHRDDVARLGHLVVELAQRRRHLVAERAGHDHHVGLARRRPEEGAEAVEVVTAH